MVFGTFLLHYFPIFEQVNTSWVFLCLVWLLLVFWSVLHMCSAVIVILHPGINDGLNFLFLALNVVHKWYSQIWYCSSLCQFASVQSHGSKTRPITVSNFVLLKVSNSGDKWIQFRSRKPDFQEVLKQNLNWAKFRSCV